MALLVAGCAEMQRLAGEARAARVLMASGPQVTQGAMDLSGEPLSMIDASMRPDPDTFAAEARVTWDGERTLQGIWVAHPLAKQARRVRIVNRETGAAVDGALFRRDGGMPGPAVLVSSDAAVALGLMPGTPVDLAITAIRRAPAEPVTVAEAAAAAPEPEPEPEAAADGAAPGGDAVADARAGAPGPVEAQADAAAAAAPDDTGAATGAEAEAEIRTVTAEDAADAGQVEQTAATSFIGPADRTPPPARNRFQPASVSGAEPEAGTAAEAPVPDRPAPDPARPEASPEPEPSAAPAREQRITPDMAAGGAGHAGAASQPEAGPEPDPEPGAEPILAALSSAAEPGREPVSALERPFIQAGIFAVADNASRLVRRIREAGYPAEGKPMTFNGRAALRVVAGPFATAAERRAALDAIRSLGPSDAVPVRR